MPVGNALRYLGIGRILKELCGGTSYSFAAVAGPRSDRPPRRGVSAFPPFGPSLREASSEVPTFRTSRLRSPSGRSLGSR